jgi:hypothetical protein
MRSAEQSLGVPQPVTLLNLPVRAARYAWRRGRETGFALRGKYILHRYTAHYRRAQRAYRDAGRQEADPRVSPYDVGVRVIDPRADDALITLPPAYAGIVERVAGRVAAAFERSANCRFFPRLPAGEVPERTTDIPALANGEVITLQLRDPFVIDGLNELCEPILRELERTIYGSFIIVDKVYIYRNPVSQQKARASWRWHFDNHPREMLKVMIYLTDVAGDTAPFQYLRERSSGAPLEGTPLRPLFGDSRVPIEEVDRCLAGNWTCHSVTGARGTIVVFDDNIVHRATLAKAAHRDVVVFQIRPATFQPAKHIDAQWTGSFGHWDFNGDPWLLAARPRAGA